MKMTDELYQEVILDHNRHARNHHALMDATHTAEGYNPLCGDHYQVHLILNAQGVIEALAFEGEGVRDERADQQQYSSPETMNRWGRERGADYMFLGELNSIFDQEDGNEVKYYQLDCYLVDLEDNTKVWVGDDRIKKFIGRSAYRP